MPARFLLCIALLTGADASAATFHADIVGDSVDALPGDGFCADAGGHCSLRAAIQESNALADGDTITLAAGNYMLTLVGSNEQASARGDLDVDGDLVLQGAGTAATTIDAGALDRVLDLLPAAGARTVHLGNLTLRNGFLDIASSKNAAGTNGLSGTGGAGIRVAAGITLQLDHVDIRDNHVAKAFVAVAVDNAGCIHGEHVRIVGNTDLAEKVGSGNALSGGIETEGEDSCLVLEDSEISDNRGDLSGALHVDGGAPVTLRRTLVANNVARSSGALELNVGGEVLLENVTISGNAGNPGAILNDGGTRLMLVNSTVTANHGSIGEPVVGGIHDVHGGFGLTTLRNTILAGNGPGFISDDCRNGNSLGGNIVGSTGGCQFDAQASDQLDVDAALAPLADNGGFTRTHLPAPNAIDHGIADGCAAQDQRGIARPQDGDGDGLVHCDVGAVEIGDIDVIFANGFEGAATAHASPRGFASTSAARSGAAERGTQGT